LAGPEFGPVREVDWSWLELARAMVAEWEIDLAVPDHHPERA